jgi:hypothetical protein
MNPIQTESVHTPPVETAPVEEFHASDAVEETAAEPAFAAAADEPTPDEVEFATANTEEIPAAADETEVEIEAPVSEAGRGEPVFVSTPGVLFQSEPKYADEVRHTLPTPLISKDGDGYAITVIEEKNSKQRNTLLLGATVFAIFTMLTAWGISLFQKDLDVGSIGDERSIALLLEDVPMPVEEEIEEKKNDDDGGGGGGGGREDKEEVNQGDLADQTPEPIRAPDAKIPRLDNPAIALPPPSTQGNMKLAAAVLLRQRSRG